MSLAYVREHRNMPFLKRGMRVESSGKPGRIAGARRWGNIEVILDGEKRSRNYHPKWMMTYFDKDGNVIKSYGDDHQ